jgi:hypothetical protein
MSEKVNIFISHKYEDEATAIRIREILKGFDDEDNPMIEFHLSEEIPGGEMWYEWITNKLKLSNLLFLLFTDPTRCWEWCLYEVGLFDLMDGDHHRRTICLHSSAIDLPDPLKHIQAFSANPNDIEKFLNLLFQDTTLTGLERPIASWISKAKEKRRKAAEEISKLINRKTIHDVQRKASSQGVGVADQREQVINIDNIFISYRRSDSADVTGRIYDRLIQQFGRDKVFKDVDSIPLGVDFRKHLNQVVSGCNILLAVMGNQWLETKDSQSKRRIDNPRDHVRIEIESALQSGVPVIPTLVRGASMPSEDDLPPSIKDLAYRNWISVRVDPDFHKDVDRLIAGIETHLKDQINKK